MPAEQNTVCYRLDVHVRTARFHAVVGFIFNDLFVKLVILTPAGYGEKLFNSVRKMRQVKVPQNIMTGVAVLIGDSEVAADKKLKQLNRGVFRGFHALMIAIKNGLFKKRFGVFVLF